MRSVIYACVTHNARSAIRHLQSLLPFSSSLHSATLKRVSAWCIGETSERCDSRDRTERETCLQRFKYEAKRGHEQSANGGEETSKEKRCPGAARRCIPVPEIATPARPRKHTWAREMARWTMATGRPPPCYRKQGVSSSLPGGGGRGRPAGLPGRGAPGRPAQLAPGLSQRGRAGDRISGAHIHCTYICTLHSMVITFVHRPPC